MAEVITSERRQKAKNSIRVKVIPVTDNSRRMDFVKVNNKIIPFDVPVVINEDDLKALRGLKESVRKTNDFINVRKIMDDLQISQEKANMIARMKETNEMNSSVDFVPKYYVQIL